MNWNGRKHQTGLTLLEVLIAFSVTLVAVLVTTPLSQDLSIRMKVNQSLEPIELAKQALTTTCGINRTAVVKSNLDANYFYVPSNSSEDYLQNVLLNADCSKHDMMVVVWTAHTGASIDPIVEFTSSPGPSREPAWTCRLIRGEERHVPRHCREQYNQG